MGDVAISIRHAAGPAFEFRTASSDAPKVTSVIVVDHPHTKEWWMLDAVRWKESRAKGSAELTERLRAAGLTVPQGMDPLADLLPPDPRYLLAKSIEDDCFRDAGTELWSLTYGVVPKGFEQVEPEHGSAPELRCGRSYKIVLLGRDFGTLVFECPDGLTGRRTTA